HTINTTAIIAAGAQINQNNQGGTPNVGQSVYVDAGRSYQSLALGLGLAVSGTVAVAPAFTVPVLQGTTSATIAGPSSGGTTNVSAQQDVDVSAVAQAKFIAVAAALTGAGTASIAASVAVVVVNTTTQAMIGGLAVVQAGSNVLVSAFDN